MAPDPAQHYISKFLIKQWAQNDEVGVVCMYHRDGVKVSMSKRGKGLHHIRHLSTADMENDWSREEFDMSKVIAGLSELVGSRRQCRKAMEKFISVPEHHNTLKRLVALHYSRSLSVAARQWIVSENGILDDVESTAHIIARENEVRDFYKCGIQINVFPPSEPIVLGAFPVFHAQDWGGHGAGTALFMMPLTPRIVVCGTPEVAAGDVNVVRASADSVETLKWQLAGTPDQFASPYVICHPSSLSRVKKQSLGLTEGGELHWISIKDRVSSCESQAGVGLSDDLQALLRYEKCCRYRFENRSIEESEKAKMRQKLVENAQKMQCDLDELQVPICCCKKHRENQMTGEMWSTLFPQVVCDNIRRQKNVERH
ncbi:hypothetical protein [Candidatus Poriferisodalis sp.]|uniref:hypothetical protein n=1 Tax=Candidatus Poriferisodalis sp. TaxID=3101277 RepID=UPI003B015DAA